MLRRTYWRRDTRNMMGGLRNEVKVTPVVSVTVIWSKAQKGIIVRMSGKRLECLQVLSVYERCRIERCRWTRWKLCEGWRRTLSFCWQVQRSVTDTGIAIWHLKALNCPRTWGIERNITSKWKYCQGYDTVEMSSGYDRDSTKCF